MSQQNNQKDKSHQQSQRPRLSLYPLKFDQVMADVLKIKPEPKELKPRLNKPPQKKAPQKRPKSE